MHDRDHRDIVDRLHDIADGGCRVVPFIGSGISALSGIMMGQDFTAYLATCVHSVVSEEAVDPQAQIRMLRQGVWRAVFSENDLWKAARWLRRNIGRRLAGSDIAEADVLLLERGSIQEICALYDSRCAALDPTSDISPFTEDFVIQEGVRSLRDWRSALGFLARIEERGGVVGLRPAHATADQHIVDSFVRQLVSNRMPNFTHKMLAQISGVLNVRMLLTTNFDDLLERAIESLGKTLGVIEIPLGARLPLARSLSLGRVLVKLHGGLIQARADASLDHAPSTDDVEAFASYLTAGNVFETTSEPVWLLVVGYSGSDRRCIDMIKNSMWRQPALRVLWLAHTPNDIDYVKRRFHEPSFRGLIGTDREHRIQILLCDRPDLVMHEAYQRITRSLPAGGFAYRFAYKLPPTISANAADLSPFADRLHENAVAPSFEEEVKTVATRVVATQFGAGTSPGRTNPPGVVLRSTEVELRGDRSGAKQSIPNSWTLVVSGSGALRIASTIFSQVTSPPPRSAFGSNSWTIAAPLRSSSTSCEPWRSVAASSCRNYS